MSTALVLALVASALIAAVNPCTMGVFVMSISSLLGAGKHPRHAGVHSFFFAVGVALWAFFAAALSLLILTWLPVGVVGYIGLVVAVVLVVSGLIEIKDYFWYGRGLSFKLGARAETSIHKWTKQHHSHVRGLLLGIYSSIVSSHYTFGLIAASMVIVRLSGHVSYGYPVLWAVVYGLPLLSFSQLVLYGVSVVSISSWREQSKASMRLAIGLLFVLIGWVLILSSVSGVSFL